MRSATLADAENSKGSVSNRSTHRIIGIACYDGKIPMALRFYNTLTQQLEHFTPLSGNTVKMYTCGPTVYNYVHIGNLRAFTSQDILRRWLLHRGYTLDHVMNI